MTGSVNGIQLGSKGRLVVPAALRRELGINAGERLSIRVENGALIVEPRRTVGLIGGLAGDTR